jgi:hypothetical protein
MILYENRIPTEGKASQPTLSSFATQLPYDFDVFVHSVSLKFRDAQRSIGEAADTLHSIWAVKVVAGILMLQSDRSRSIFYRSP